MSLEREHARTYVAMYVKAHGVKWTHEFITKAVNSVETRRAIHRSMGHCNFNVDEMFHELGVWLKENE